MQEEITAIEALLAQAQKEYNKSTESGFLQAHALAQIATCRALLLLVQK